MKNMFFWLVRQVTRALLFIQRRGTRHFWEHLNDLPEGKRYVVIGLMPANHFTSDRPIWIADADQFVGPMILHSSKAVETRSVMLQSAQIDGRIRLGDEVESKSGMMIVVQKGKLNYEGALGRPDTAKAA